MTSSQNLMQELLGEIVGMRATMKTIVAQTVLLSKFGEDELREMHQLAHTLLQRMNVETPGLDAEAIAARAETVVDQMFGSIRVRTREQEPK